MCSTPAASFKMSSYEGFNAISSDGGVSLVIGVDVGGTSTDAALLLMSSVNASEKTRGVLDEWEAHLTRDGRCEEAEALRIQRREKDEKKSTGSASSLVLGFVKRPTTDDVSSGVMAAVRAVLGDVWRGHRIAAVFVGTTLFVKYVSHPCARTRQNTFVPLFCDQRQRRSYVYHSIQ